MIKKTILITTLMPILGSANTQNNYHEYTAEELKSAIVAPYTAMPNGLPKPGQGLEIKSLKELDPENYTRYKTSKQSLTFSVTEYNDSNDAKLLIDTVELENVDYTKYELNTDPEDTEIKKSLAQLNIRFNYKSLPKLSYINISGYAVNGMHTPKGWTGVSEFFKHSDLGHCVYERTNYNIKNGAIYLPKERTNKDINNKITMTYHYGNPKDGYNYTVSWYEDDFINELRCANKISSSHLAKKLIGSMMISVEKALFNYRRHYNIYIL